jgi:DNA invertase Pin-like site-specific DNA recombinase
MATRIARAPRRSPVSSSVVYAAPVSARAVIYARQSKDTTGDAAAVERQLDACRHLAERYGWSVVAEVVDNDVSATRGDRPGWRQLLTEIDAGRYDVLMTWHPDRLYRRVRDLVDLLGIAERRSLRIAAVQAGDLDLSTPAGRMVASLVGSVAEYEVAHKADRQRAANRQRASRGHVGWSLRPYGYDKIDGRIVIVEREADVLREVARRVLSGESTRSVIADLNARGITTTTGGRWQTTPLRRSLISPRLAGRAVLNGEDFGKGDWPAIFDADTHDRLVGLFKDPARRRQTGVNVKHLLSGLLVCGRCGAVMFALPARRGHSASVYACKDGAGHLSRRQAELDDFIERVVIARLSRPDALDLLVPDVDVDALRAQAVELRDRRDAIAEMLAEGIITSGAAREQARRLTDHIGELEAGIGAAVGTSPAANLASADDVAAAWEALDLPGRREVIRTLMRITVLPARRGRLPFDPATVAIQWRQP